MTSPPQRVTVKCPSCGKEYETVYRPSINLQLDHFDEEYIKKVTTATCPHCRHTVAFNVLIVGEDGTLTFHEGGEEQAP
jgi:DNA-directed RNA polymerase subunit RPC12/RpoP